MSWVKHSLPVLVSAVPFMYQRIARRLWNSRRWNRYPSGSVIRLDSSVWIRNFPKVITWINGSGAYVARAFHLSHRIQQSRGQPVEWKSLCYFVWWCFWRVLRHIPVSRKKKHRSAPGSPCRLPRYRNQKWLLRPYRSAQVARESSRKYIFLPMVLFNS